MANDYLISKWKLWYTSLDVNHDGKISYADMEESRNKFIELRHLEKESKKIINANFDKWWNDFIFDNKIGAEISQDYFVNRLNGDFKADKKAFVKKMQECFNEFFAVIDTNKSRCISEYEFLIAFKVYGHENFALDTRFFKAYKPVDGLVSLKDIVGSWVHFATSEDCSKPDVVKQCFD